MKKDNIAKDITQILFDTFQLQEKYFEKDISEILVFNATYLGVLIKAITKNRPDWEEKYLKAMFDKIKEVVGE